MAIDSEVKRKSVAGAGARFWRPGVVVPDATIDVSDRAAIGRSYAGIAAGAAVSDKLDIDTALTLVTNLVESLDIQTNITTTTSTR